MINPFTHITMLAGLSLIYCLHGSLYAQEPQTELPAWAAATIPRAQAYEKTQADKEYAEKVRPNLPSEPIVKPANPRKLLVFDNPRNFRHTAEVLLRMALPEMSRATGAFEATLTDNPAFFTPENLKQFDAVFFNNVNSVNNIGCPDLAGCQAILDFVTAGGGFAANHASLVALNCHPDFKKMIGGTFFNHPFGGKEVYIKNEAKGSLLTAAFGDTPFPFTDEIFTVKGPYSRDQQTVLLSIDWEKSPEAVAIDQKAREQQKELYSFRDDNDYAVSWIKPYGKGRVFYTSLGHAHETIANPRYLKHLLAGIQYACGDIEHRTLTTTPTNSK
jgi:type 1 glutamine amidotransferase